MSNVMYLKNFDSNYKLQHNYFDGLIKLFSDIYLATFLEKLFFL